METSLLPPILALLLGLALLLWSADRFVSGSAVSARYFGAPPLLIGMVVVGFGTSAPEMIVSALAAAEGNAGISLGNAYGSNIANIALILGLSAILRPIMVHSQVLRKELPVLTAATLFAVYQAWNGVVSRTDAGVLLAVFAGLMGWTVYEGLRRRTDAFGAEVEQELTAQTMTLGRAVFWVTIGLAALILSSRVLVWGAVEVAHGLGVSDLVIGLTIVAVGTSLPELASSLVAARRGEDDIALGNIVGSNLFNTLAVVGVAGLIRPLPVAAEILSRDLVVMVALTLSLFAVGYGFRGPGRINRFEGIALVVAFVVYTVYLVATGSAV